MRRAGIAIAALASLAAATVGTGSILSRANATDGAQPNTSCATTTACIEGDNTSTGPGVKGTSTKGLGVVGTTKAKGTTMANGRAAVLGQDLQSGSSSFFNAGVMGTSTNSIGVWGTSTNNVAIFGNSTNYVGVTGQGSIGLGAVGNSIGVLASGTTEGVQGGTGLGDAIYATSFGGNLFRGNNSNSLDVFVVDNSGNTSIGGALTAGGAVTGLNGAFGSSEAGIGLLGDGASAGVEGEDTGGGDVFFANGFGGLLFRGNNSLSEDVFEVDDGGNVFAVSYNFLAEATKLQRTSSGQTVKTYSSQAAQPTLEDTGEAQLVNGVARVALDPAFAASIDRSNYVVLVTPQGMTQGVLCVAQRSASGFVVQENMGGRSTVQFAYRIVAKPYGSTSPRLPVATLQGHFDQRVAKARVEPRIYKAPRHSRPPLRLPIPKG